jgi:beta-galactosidase
MKAFFLLILVALLFSSVAAQKQHTFKIGNGNFLLDGKPFQIISGEMHFARIPQEYWRDRLHMAKAMGLNTIATYVFWNYHEPEPGKFNFNGNADVAGFVKTAQEEGLWVIVRPSPYACAEWEFGGYPWWLLKEKDLKVRSKDPRFIELSTRYFTQLGKQLAPLQITRGGNVIMVQLENEYGSYSNDKEYLALNEQIIRKAGFDVDLYTCDGPSQMPNGYLPGLLPAVNGLDNVKEVKELINKYHDGKGPYFIAEWYPAWFDSWGLPHHVVPAAEYVGRLDTILANGISINMYMAHGGTTRWFMNGANMSARDPYAPQTSSYDYDAPINEAGNSTQKFLAFREVIKKHLPPEVVLPEVPSPKKSITIPEIQLSEHASVLENLPEPVLSDRPLSFEDLDQGYGYVLYRTTVQGPLKGLLDIQHVRDYAIVLINGKRVAVLDRRLKQGSVEVDVPAGEVTLDMVLENLGRINYGPYLNDNRKGITERVTLGGKELRGFKMYRFPCTDFSGLKYKRGKAGDGPVVRRGTFNLEEVGDTYLDMRQWGKGSAWVNGHSLGRYWDIGPQQTLYVPAPWLKKGTNELIVVELLDPQREGIGGLDVPILDQLRVSEAGGR